MVFLFHSLPLPFHRVLLRQWGWEGPLALAPQRADLWGEREAD